MSAASSHIIHQFHLTLEVDEEVTNDYSLLLDELSQLGNEALPQVLEQVLTKAFPHGIYQRLDRLEVEVEVDSLDEIVRAIQKELPRQLGQVFQGQLIHSSPNGRFSKVVAGDGPGQWLYAFLRTGSLPTAAPKKLSVAQLAELSQAWLASQPEWQGRLYRLLLKEPQALRRLLQHFGAEWLWLFVQGAGPAGKSEESFTRWQRARQYAKVQQQGQVAILQFWQAELAEVEQLQRGFRSIEEKKRVSIHLPSEDTVEETGVAAQYYLEEAGLILLHPFLGNLLKTLDLATGSEVKDPAQAASVLYSLAWGHGPEAEWQLVLPKLLLGLPLDKLVEPRKVSSTQLEIGQEMITAAIAHWAVLGNTSVAGFRESFLQRPGRLDETADGWSILLEQRPYDMLLDQLPWQMSFVQLPWMNQIIRLLI